MYILCLGRAKTSSLSTASRVHPRPNWEMGNVCPLLSIPSGHSSVPLPSSRPSQAEQVAGPFCILPSQPHVTTSSAHLSAEQHHWLMDIHGCSRKKEKEKENKTLTREAEAQALPLLSHIFLNNSHIPLASFVKWDNDAFLGFFTGIRQALEPR